MRAGKTLVFIFCALFLSACVHQEVEISDLDGQTTPKASSPEEEMTSELVIEDLAIGSGTEVKEGDRVAVHYTGTFSDGRVFDSSRERNTPFTFTVGRGDVIKGWDVGIPGMYLGGRRRLTIPPQFAYGSQGMGDVIPPNATLVFEIEVLGINPPVNQR